MRRFFFTLSAFVTPLLLATLVFGQAGTIGIFSDVTGTDPTIEDRHPRNIKLYVVHMGTDGATACQFRATKPWCFDATFLGDTQVFPCTIGNSQDFVAIGYGSCLSSPIHVLTMNFFGTGNSGDSCVYPIEPWSGWYYPWDTSIGEVQMVDCNYELFDMDHQGLMINPPADMCPQPELSLVDFETVSWEDPLWNIRVRLKNTTDTVCKDATITMYGGPSSIEILDSECAYGDLSGGAASWGEEDGFLLDLTHYGGKVLNLKYDVTYKDICGRIRTVTLDPDFALKPVSVGEPSVMTASAIGQNYPNPFNPTTTIPITIAEATGVQLSVFDSRGKLVRLLVDDYLPAGSRQVVWDGRDSNGNSVSSGVYFCQLKMNAETQTRKLMLLK